MAHRKGRGFIRVVGIRLSVIRWSRVRAAPAALETPRQARQRMADWSAVERRPRRCRPVLGQARSVKAAQMRHQLGLYLDLNRDLGPPCKLRRSTLCQLFWEGLGSWRPWAPYEREGE